MHIYLCNIHLFIYKLQELASMCAFINLHHTKPKNKESTKKAGFFLDFHLCTSHSCKSLSTKTNSQTLINYLNSQHYIYWTNRQYNSKLKMYILIYTIQECKDLIKYFKTINPNLIYFKEELCYKSLPWNDNHDKWHKRRYIHTNIFLNNNKNKPFITLYEYLKIKYIDFGKTDDFHEKNKALYTSKKDKSGYSVAHHSIRHSQEHGGLFNDVHPLKFSKNLAEKSGTHSKYDKHDKYHKDTKTKLYKLEPKQDYFHEHLHAQSLHHLNSSSIQTKSLNLKDIFKNNQYREQFLHETIMSDKEIGAQIDNE